MAVRQYSEVEVSTQLLTKIFSHITIDANGCWLWNSHDVGRYGLIRWNKVVYSTHRLMYCLFVEQIELPLHCDHLCRVPSCVNPAHLEAVSPRENYLRGRGPSAQNARKTHCIKGHPLSGDNLRITPEGHRVCRTCRNLTGVQQNRKKGYGVRRDNSKFCQYGHEYTPDNLYVHPRGYNICRICRREQKRLARLKRQMKEVASDAPP